MGGYIEHEGVIMTLKENKATVMIIQQSACSGCHAKSACTAADRADKQIDAELGEDGDFCVGEQVLLRGSNRIGMEAVLLAFVVPFILIVALLIIFSSLGLDDGLGAVSSLVLLALWYMVLYFFRDKLTKRFVFKIYKKSNINNKTV
ncbi:MAG: SoxR reducing system RseC family protein [Bacteroidales bacterium]